MKALPVVSGCVLLLASNLPATARDPGLRYQFAAGETNVYRVEVEQRMESGSSTTAGNVVVTPLNISSNIFRLGFRGSFEVKNSSSDRAYPPFSGGMRWSGGAALPEGCELQFDDRGNVLRATSDYPLPLPLGSVLTALIQPVPATGRGESIERSFVADAPLWLGPVPVLLPSQGYGPPYYMSYVPRQNLALVAVLLRTEWNTIATVSNLVTLRKKFTLESPLKFNREPQITASGEGEVVFDSLKGMIARVEMNCASHGSSETVSRENRVTLKIRRLEGRERDDVLNPPPAPVPAPVVRKLSAADLQTLAADLKSGEVEKQRAAINRLRDAELDAPQPELAALVATFGLDDDGGVRQSVATFLLKHGTANEVPMLLKQLKDPEESVCLTAAKALARLKDERAVAPLTDLLAGGIRLNQYNQVQNYQFIPEIAAAIQSLGAPAEGAVAALLAERSIETRRQACLILKQIGTSASLEALQKVVGDSNPQVNQAAAEAIRAIKQRL